MKPDHVSNPSKSAAINPTNPYAAAPVPTQGLPNAQPGTGVPSGIMPCPVETNSAPSRGLESAQVSIDAANPKAPEGISAVSG
jgi:hypothetical protein